MYYLQNSKNMWKDVVMKHMPVISSVEKEVTKEKVNVADAELVHKEFVKVVNVLVDRWSRWRSNYIRKYGEEEYERYYGGYYEPSPIEDDDEDARCSNEHGIYFA